MDDRTTGSPRTTPAELVHDAGSSDAEAARSRVSDEALEINQLVVELIHVAYATRNVDAEPVETAAGSAGPLADGRRVPTVSPHAVRAAIHVYRHGGRTIGELAEGLGISLGWASRVVHELEGSGLVRRAADSADRRIVHVSLTPEALAMVGRAYLWRAEAIDRALEALDPGGRSAVEAFLRRVVEEMGRAGRDARREPC